MKKTFIIIPTIVLLASCGGGTQNQNGGTATETNGREAKMLSKSSNGTAKNS
jgi:hypothetical protein